MKFGRTKDGLVTFTIDHVRDWDPCYDPSRYLEEGKHYTALSILQDECIPPEDRIWCVLRPELASDKLMRLFAVWCARQVQHLITDERSLKAIDVAERYAHGRATREELDAARAAAWDAAWAAAQDAALAAARVAARVAARAAARVTAWDAAWAAAQDAAWAAAQVGVRDAARAAARDAQIKQAIKLFKAEGKERINKGGNQ